MKIYEKEGSITQDYSIQGENKEKEKKEENNFLNYKYISYEANPIYINNKEELKTHMYNILNKYYVGIYQTDNVLHIVTENENYYAIDLNEINKEDLKDLFIHEKPNIVCFNINRIRDYISDKTKNILDLKVMFKVILKKNFKSEKEMYSYFKVNNLKGIQDMCYNNILLAKSINIYVEKNKINSYVYLELFAQKIMTYVFKTGFPVDEEKYKEFTNNLEKKFNQLKEKNINYNDKTALLRYLSDKDKYVSLNPTILKSECPELLEDINTFKQYYGHKKHTLKEGRLYIYYDGYDVHTYSIKESLIPDSSYYVEKDIDIVEGSYNNLYYKILAELTRDKTIIEKASDDILIDYIFEKLELKNAKNKDKFYSLIAMFIDAYSNNLFYTTYLKEYFLKVCHTSVDDNDIKGINNLFYKKVPELMKFFKSFDGKGEEYKRYNTKIFYPNTNLYHFIKQIENLIIKTGIEYIYNAIEDFNNKYKYRAINFVGFYDKKIVLSSEKKYTDIAQDILNRYMAKAYKRYIKNTKYHNTTSLV